METLRVLASAELANTTTSLSLNRVKEFDWAENKVMTDTLSELETENNSLSLSLIKNRASVYTSLIKETDGVCDNLLTGIRLIVKGYCFLPGDEGESANKIFSIIKPHANITRLSYDEESALITSIYNKVTDAEHLPHLEKFPILKRMFEMVNTENVNIKSLLKESAEYRTQQAAMLPAGKQKRIVIDILNSRLLPYLQIIMLSYEDKYKLLYNDIQNIILKANTKIKMSATKPTNEVALEN